MKLLLSLLIPVILLSACSISLNTTWQGAFYKNGDTLGKPEYSPIFTDFPSCKNWVLSKAIQTDKYTCNKNCENIGMNDMQQCETVVRNWIINEGTATFDSYNE